MIRNEKSRMCSLEPCDFGVLVSRDENAQLLVGELILVDSNVSQEIFLVGNITAVINARKSIRSAVAAGVMRIICETEVVVCGSPLRKGQDGNFARDEGNLKSGSWGL